MMKRGIPLYLDSDVYEKLKKEGHNVSELVNKFLKDFIKAPVTPADMTYTADQHELKARELRLEADKLKASEELKTKKTQELLKDPWVKEMAKRVMENPDPTTTNANRKALKNTFGVELTPSEFADFVKEAIK